MSDGGEQARIDIAKADDDELEELRALVDELGADMGEAPRGLDFKRLVHDQQLRGLAIRLWHDYQARVSISRRKFEEALEQDDLTMEDLWAPGIVEQLEVGSTADEVERYKKKLRFRIRILEVLLLESRDDLGKAERWAPAAANDADIDPGAESGPADDGSEGGRA